MPDPAYAARDAAFASWAANGLCLATAGERQFAKAIFCAGWDARKRVEMMLDERAWDYVSSGKNNLAEHLDRTKQDVLSLFPTEAEINGQ